MTMGMLSRVGRITLTMTKSSGISTPGVAKLPKVLAAEEMRKRKRVMVT